MLSFAGTSPSDASWYFKRISSIYAMREDGYEAFPSARTSPTMGSVSDLVSVSLNHSNFYLSINEKATIPQLLSVTSYNATSYNSDVIVSNNLTDTFEYLDAIAGHTLEYNISLPCSVSNSTSFEYYLDEYLSYSRPSWVTLDYTNSKLSLSPSSNETSGNHAF